MGSIPIARSIDLVIQLAFRYGESIWGQLAQILEPTFAKLDYSRSAMGRLHSYETQADEKERKGKRRAAIPSGPVGFDYGCLPYVMAVGSLDFPRHLSAAGIGAVAYGRTWSDVVEKIVPTITLVAQNGAELAKAFAEFSAWSKATDPDAVEIIFVFRKSGGYVLSISVEQSRLQRRCLGFHRTQRALIFAPAWFKPLDTVNPLLLNFRRRLSAPIAPFLFDGAVYNSRLSAWSGSGGAAPPDLQMIPGLEPLLKFEAEFIDEDQVTPNTIGWAALNARTLQPPQSRNALHRMRPSEIARQRIDSLRCHFPVTLERIRRTSAMVGIFASLRSEGVRVWQIEQAICNLVLTADMRRSGHFSGFHGRAGEQAVLKALDSRHEMADGGDVPVFEAADTRRQIVADANALLRYLGEKSADDLAKVQAALKSASVLEAQPALGKSAETNATE